MGINDKTAFMNKDHSLVTALVISSFHFAHTKYNTSQNYREVFDKLAPNSKEIRKLIDHNQGLENLVPNYLSNVPQTFYDLSRGGIGVMRETFISCYAENTREFQDEFGLYMFDIDEFETKAYQKTLKNPKKMSKKIQEAYQRSIVKKIIGELDIMYLRMLSKF